jgi:Putative addiction module component
LKANPKKQSDEIESPAWHEKVLRERDERHKSGKEKPISWEKAKRQLRKLRY